MDNVLATDLYYDLKELCDKIDHYESDTSLYYDDTLSIIPDLIVLREETRNIMRKCLPFVIID